MDPILQALQRQLECYRSLLKLAEIQHQHVESGSTEALLEVLQRRQEVLDELNRLEAEAAPAKRQWQQYIESLDLEQREQAELAVAQARVLLEQIVSADRDDALVLQQRKLNVGRQIQQASTGRRVGRSYAAGAGYSTQNSLNVKR